MAPSPTKILKRASRLAGLQRHRISEYAALQRQRVAIQARLDSGPGVVGLIGCGAQGRVINTAISRLPKWEIGALFDVRVDAATELGAQWPNALVHENLDEFARAVSSLDVVVISTTASSRFELAKTVIDNGARAVFLEKPVTASLVDADRLVQLAQQSGCRVAVNHTRRYLDSVAGVKRVLDSGAIGEPRAIHFVAGRAGFAMIGTHLLDLARQLLESDVLRVRSRLDESLDPTPRGPQFRDPTGYAEASMSNGCRVTLDLSDDLNLRQLFYVVACGEGRLEIDERLGHLRLIGRGQHVWTTDYALPGTLDAGISRALVELKANKVPRCDVTDGRAALEAVVACHQSHREGGDWVSLPISGDVREETFPFA